MTVEPNSVPKRTYRPDIDGLRAIAVLGVFVFHLNEAWLPGGFVGVDVFFVISGYLIGSIILTECERGEFSFARFYQRRIARILPHSAFVATVALILATMLYMPEDTGAVATAYAASALSAANVKFALQGSYFDFQPDGQPLLHYWSLGVEEQFYLVLPAILWLLASRARRWMSPVLVILLLLSLGTCIVTTAIKPVWAFFLLPSRMWEMLAGCLLAQFVSTRGHSSTGCVSESMSILGLILVAGSLILIPGGPRFPGFLAIFPVLGTALVIGPTGQSSRLVGSPLGHPVFVAIGRLSFALYLWHWPVFCFVDYCLFAQSAVTRLSIKISASVVLSVLGYFAIEQTARRWLNSHDRCAHAYLGFASVVVISVVAGVFVRLDNYAHIGVSLDQMRRGGVSQPSDGGPRVVLVGDSTAGMYGRLFLECAITPLDCQRSIQGRIGCVSRNGALGSNHGLCVREPPGCRRLRHSLGTEAGTDEM